jgi:hypothetical protein
MDWEKFVLGVSKTEMMVIPSKKNAKTSIPYSVGVSHGIEESLIVSVARKRRLSCRTPVHDVIHRIGKLDPQWTRHGPSSTRKRDNYSTPDLTPSLQTPSLHGGLPLF